MKTGGALTRVTAGALVRGARLHGDQYQCDRCGHIYRFRQWAGRKRPTTCQDCRDVEADLDGDAA